jgi:hypothetical protein
VWRRGLDVESVVGFHWGRLETFEVPLQCVVENEGSGKKQTYAKIDGQRGVRQRARDPEKTVDMVCYLDGGVWDTPFLQRVALPDQPGTIKIP